MVIVQRQDHVELLVNHANSPLIIVILFLVEGLYLAYLEPVHHFSRRLALVLIQDSRANREVPLEVGRHGRCEAWQRACLLVQLGLADEHKALHAVTRP